MEHDIVMIIGMLAAFVLGAKIDSITFSFKRQKHDKKQAERESAIKKQEQSLSNYNINSYPRKGGNNDG